MVADVVLAEPGGLGSAATRPADPSAGRGAGETPAERRRGRRLAVSTLLVLGCVFSGVCVLLVLASWRDDAAIDAHPGRAAADVLSVSFNRTAVRFASPDGTVYIPTNGVLYPEGLTTGEQVWIDYDTANPDLARVAGRTYRLTFLPVGSTLLVGWALLGPAIWWLRRQPA